MKAIIQSHATLTQALRTPDTVTRGTAEKGMTEDENGHEFEQALGAGDGQGGLACYSPWGCKELDTTEQLN